MSRGAAASGMLAVPNSSVLDAPRGAPSGALAWAGFGACALHVLLLGAALATSKKAIQHDVSALSAVPKLEVELVQLPPPPEPEPEPEPETRPTQPKAAPAPKPVVRAPKPTPAPPKEAPPPAAAESAKLVAAEAVDFGDSFVMGNAASHAGGVSANAGTSKQAVHDRNAHANGVQGGTGKDPAADATRAPALASGHNWDCPFPVEADDAGVDTAVVGLRVEVSADGKVREARALSDPGHGFAREARRCALSKRWTPGLDRAGNPTIGVALINVRFDR